METLFHAFNWQLSEVRSHLKELGQAGFTGIQVSPLQACLSDEDAWFLRYQPYDHTKLSGRGSADELRDVCQMAADDGLIIVADLVFNHMGPVFGEQKAADLWARIQAGDESPRAEINALLRGFPGLSEADFHPFRPIGGFDYDNDQLRLDGWGGNGSWPDLKPTKNVLNRQFQHIEQLLKCGVRGFRFDAVKQMHVKEQYSPLIDACRKSPEVRLVYGEVLSLNIEMHEEYAQSAPTTDFLLMAALVEAFETKSDLRLLENKKMLECPALLFSRNHDTVMQHLPNLSFQDEHAALLAGTYVLMHLQSPVLVYCDDFLHDPEGLTKAALNLRRSWQKVRGTEKPKESVVRRVGKETAEPSLWLMEWADGSAILWNHGRTSLKLKDVECQSRLTKLLETSASIRITQPSEASRSLGRESLNQLLTLRIPPKSFVAFEPSQRH